MNSDVFSNNWALIVAVVPALLALVVVVNSLLGRTANGQLRKVLSDYRAASKELAAARKLSKKAVARVGKLAARTELTRPRLLQEAREAAGDAQSLEKIAGDRIQVAANHVRRVIHEEFPPVRQMKLREKYLPQDVQDDRPYTF